MPVIEEYKQVMLTNIRKLYEVMCKSMPDLGKKNNFVLVTVNSKSGEWNGDMSMGVAMADGNFAAPIFSHESFIPIKKALRNNASMKVLILFNDMVATIVEIISHEQKKENAKFIRKMLDLTKENSVYIWADKGHKYTKIKTPSGKFIFMPNSYEAIRDIFDILTLDDIEEMFNVKN